MPRAEPWLKSDPSTGKKLSSLRPSKPGPNVISGLAPVQVPNSAALMVAVGVGDVLLDEAATPGADATEADGWDATQPVTLETVAGDGVATLDAAVATEALPAVPAEAALPLVTAALISSAVTSGTRRSSLKMQPTGSSVVSPI